MTEVESQTFLGRWNLAPPPLRWGVSHPRNAPVPHKCYRCKFGSSRSSASRLSRSLKVIETDTDRSTTYDFLLVFRSNYGPISYPSTPNFG